jgi:hypothetical protein
LGSIRPLAGLGHGLAAEAVLGPADPGAVRIFSMTGCFTIVAMIFSSPPQFGHCSRSMSKARWSSRAHFNN